MKLSYKCAEKEAHQAGVNMSYANQQEKKKRKLHTLVLVEIISDRGDNFFNVIILNISLIRRNYE